MDSFIRAMPTSKSKSVVGGRRADELEPLLGLEQVPLARVGTDGDDNLVEDRPCTPDHVEMTVRDGVERPRHDCSHCAAFLVA